MEELFHENLHQYSRRRADFLYLLDVILLYRISLIKKINGMNWLQNISMLQSYLKSGWRSFLKYKTYSLINILGLTVGFSASLVLFIIIKYENSFDRFHDRSDRIYKVGTRWSGGDLDDNIVTPQIPLMEDEYADIVRGSRFFEWEDILQYEDHFVRSSYHLVDSSFAGMFDFPLISGNLEEALTGPDRIALTEGLANKIFGDQDPLGKTISLVNEKQQLVVTAVLAVHQKIQPFNLKHSYPGPMHRKHWQLIRWVIGTTHL
jgi:putative ABC transport system permease protein